MNKSKIIQAITHYINFNDLFHIYKMDNSLKIMERFMANTKNIMLSAIVNKIKLDKHYTMSFEKYAYTEGQETQSKDMLMDYYTRNMYEVPEGMELSDYVNQVYDKINPYNLKLIVYENGEE